MLCTFRSPLTVLRRLGTVLGIAVAWGGAIARAESPQDAFAAVVKALLPPGQAASDWRGLEGVSQILWEPLPPNMLQDALPDGSMFSRKGTANVAGRRLAVLATGARTMVNYVYFRTEGTPLGEAAVVEALARRGLEPELIRCPIKASPAVRDRWWRLPGAAADHWFAFHGRCNGTPCEEFAVMLVAPPSMTPQEQRLYTERCAPGAPRMEAAPAAAWDVQLASLLAAFVPSAATLIVEWTALDGVTTVRWQPLPPQETHMPVRDTNHFVRSGETDLGGRALYLTATGTKSAVLNVHVEDRLPQADRGDVLQALERSGFDVLRVRCGRVYQLSAADWYRVTKPGLHPVMLRSGRRCDTTACPRAQETHTLALGGVLPPLQAGEIDAVGGRCPGR